MTEPRVPVTSEGVDEGSPASTAEDVAAGPVDEEQPTGPVDLETIASKGARAASGPGQQLEAGEG